MSLGCTPQTGKILNYNSSVNNQVAHKTVQLILVKLGNKIAQNRETVKKGKKQKIRDSEDGELAPGLTPSKHDPIPIAVTVRETGSWKRDDGGSSDDVERVTSRVRHGRHNQRQATTSNRQRLVRQEEAATRLSHSRRR